jgi:hypothetical protein
LIEELSQLSEKELKEVQKLSSLLLQGDGTSTREGKDEEMVHDAICSELSERIPYRILPRASHYKEFKAKASELAEWVRENLEPKTKLERKKGLSILIRILCRWLRDCNVPLSHRALTRNLQKVPGLVDREFPGYLESGLLPIVLSKNLQ